MGVCEHKAPSLYEDGIDAAVRGTPLGHVLVAGVAHLLGRHANTSGITGILNDACGTDLARATVQAAPASAGRVPRPEGEQDRKVAGGRIVRDAPRRQYVPEGEQDQKVAGGGPGPRGRRDCVRVRNRGRPHMDCHRRGFGGHTRPAVARGVGDGGHHAIL